MRIDLLFPALPPALDGIGDHTARFAKALAPHADVRILTAQPDARPIPGVSIERAFTLQTRAGIQAVQDAIEKAPPDVLFVQFNQFSYGRWGLNPYLHRTLASIKEECPTIHVAWMAHEDFVPPTNWRNRIMRLWQRWQFKQLGRIADTIFFSIEPWVRQYASWFPETPIRHLPVGSNMPNLGIDRLTARKQIGLPQSIVVAGLFGTMHASRMLPLVRRTAEALCGNPDKEVLFLYVGPDGDVVRDTLGSFPLWDAGRLSAEDVSLHLSAMDFQLAPFIDGISTRRGSALAAMQHGLPIVTTDGPLTDPILKTANGDALFLAPLSAPDQFVEHARTLTATPRLRDRMGRAARALYQDAFSFEVTTTTFLNACLPSTSHERRHSHAAG